MRENYPLIQYGYNLEFEIGEEFTRMHRMTTLGLIWYVIILLYTLHVGYTQCKLEFHNAEFTIMNFY